MGKVYLIHFDKKLKHANHYIGYVVKDSKKSLNNRFETHKKGNGAKLLSVLNNLGIDYKIVRVWSGVNKNFERLLKNRKNASKICPVCNPKNKCALYTKKKKKGF